MSNREELEVLFKNHGYADFKWLESNDIEVSNWVRFRLISEYREAVVFHFEKKVEQPQERKLLSREERLKLLNLERAVFLAGYYKALLIPFDSCTLCDTCEGTCLECKNPIKVRAGADALGIDVYATVRKAGYLIQVLKDYNENMNRYAFLLID